jgi:hypothetical protein
MTRASNTCLAAAYRFRASGSTTPRRRCGRRQPGYQVARDDRGGPVRTLLIILIVLAIIALVMFILGRRRI